MLKNEVMFECQYLRCPITNIVGVKLEARPIASDWYHIIFEGDFQYTTPAMPFKEALQILNAYQSAVEKYDASQE